MAGSVGPSQIVRALMEGISAQRWPELHELYADEAFIEYPFAVPGPRRISGRAAIRDYFAAVAGAPLVLETHNMVVHLMADPEVVVAEWDYDGLVTATGCKFHVANIQMTRVRAGKIVSSHDYHNHWVMAAAMGRLDQLVEVVEKDVAAERRSRGLTAI